jgi:large subunit ribosomal protein L13e
MTKKWAQTVGIAVDHRRTNTSAEQLQSNVERLSAYKNKLIIFPRKEGQPKKGYVNDATAEVCKAATQVEGNLPLAAVVAAPEFRAITADAKAQKVYRKLRVLRKTARYQGRRNKKAEEEAAKDK